MRANLSKIAACADINVDTMSKQIKKLIEEKKFEKTTPGKLFSPNEVKKLEKIFDFKFREIK